MPETQEKDSRGGGAAGPGWFLVAIAAVIFALSSGRLDDPGLVGLIASGAVFLTGLTLVHGAITRR